MTTRVRVQSLSGYVQNTQEDVEDVDCSSDCFVSGTMAAVLRVLRFAGVAPLRFVREKSGWRVSVSQALSFYGYIVVTLIILLTCGTLVYDLNVTQINSITRTNTRRNVLWLTDFGLMMLIAGTAVYCAPSQMRGMIQYLSHLQKINHDLNVNHWPMYHEKKKIIILIICVIFTAALICIDNVTHVKSLTWISVIYMSYYLFFWIMQLEQMKFILITMYLLGTFKAINENLKDLLYAISDFNKILPLVHFNEVNKECRSSSRIIGVNSMIAVSDNTDAEGVPKPAQLLHQTVRRLGLVYANTSDVLREVDRCHGLMLVMLLGAIYFNLLCTLYHFTNNLFEVEKFGSLISYLMKLALKMLWSIYRVWNLVMLIEPCHLTHVEIQNTRELVNHLTQCSRSSYGPLEVQLKLFCRHLMLNQPFYSPLKLMTMSRALIFTILGSIITYIVIVIEH